MSVTDSISVVAVCGECAMAFRRDPELGMTIDQRKDAIVVAWETAKKDLERHRKVAHPPDTWEQLATDMLRKLGDGRVTGGSSFTSRLMALREASR